MAASVKEVLKSSLHKDGGKFTAQDIPPTPADGQMRDKHTSASIPYNMKHALDHLSAALGQFEKLSGQNPAKAKAFAKKVCADLDEVKSKVEKYCG